MGAGDQTQILMFLWQAPYRLSHLASPSFHFSEVCMYVGVEFLGHMAVHVCVCIWVYVHAEAIGQHWVLPQWLPTLFLETGLELSLGLTNLAYLIATELLGSTHLSPQCWVIDIVCCAQLLFCVLAVWTWFYAKAVITLLTEPFPWPLTSVLSSDLMIFILLLLKWLITLTPFPCAC